MQQIVSFQTWIKREVYMFYCPTCNEKLKLKKTAFQPYMLDRKRGFKLKCMICGFILPKYISGRYLKKNGQKD